MKKNNNIEENKLDFILSTLQQVYKLMCDSGIEEIVTNIEQFNLKIKRFSLKEQPKSLCLEKEKKLDKNEQENISAQPEISGEEILSPINGVFYRSPSPGAPPFVKEGDIVAAGSVLCLVEAMKIMNEIKSNKKCKILKVLCENGSSVSVGTKLFLVEPV
ncbi:MAG: acetyl-CoA carboxylase, biotin carboxyl carrier protein [Endomicrobia bacterium]|nr:acetyl-CoA carboxylase, biotin carboxyl carrier protein [Endomicrobiia bacterium]